MKKTFFTIAVILMFSLFLCSAASADVITAMAIEVNPEHPEKTASYARILGCNQERSTLTVELIVPETFRGDDVEALKVGDSIYTDGREVVIQSLRKEWDVVVINEGEYDYAEGAVYLFRDFDGNYQPIGMDDDYFWLSLGLYEYPVTDSLLFLDYIGAEFGEPRMLPVVRTAQELETQLLEINSDEYAVGFDCNNVYVVFDGEGRLAAIHRFFVPWQ